jgi:F-type H+-transporting ATPase subunit delta
VSVSSTYAEALYEAAEESGSVERVAGDLYLFLQAMESTPELERVLMSPEVDTRAKKGTVAALTEGADPLLRSFLQVLIDRGRMEDVHEIAGAYAGRASSGEHRLAVEAITAVPLGEDLRARLVERLERDTGYGIDLTTSVDPDIVGGLVLRVEGAVLDGSVRRRLETLRESLRHTPVEAAVATA